MEIEEIERGGERERERKRREEEEWERVEEWERIDTPQVWKPFEEGDSLTGKVKTIERRVYNEREYYVALIESEDGFWETPYHADLSRKIALRIKEGDMIKIVFKGMVRVGAARRYEYEVWRR